MPDDMTIRALRNKIQDLEEDKDRLKQALVNSQSALEATRTALANITEKCDSLIIQAKEDGDRIATLHAALANYKIETKKLAYELALDIVVQRTHRTRDEILKRLVNRMLEFISNEYDYISRQVMDDIPF